MRSVWPRAARKPASLRSSPAYARTVFGLRLASSWSQPRYSSDAAWKSSAMARPRPILRRVPVLPRDLDADLLGRLGLALGDADDDHPGVGAGLGPVEPAVGRQRDPAQVLDAPDLLVQVLTLR